MKLHKVVGGLLLALALPAGVALAESGHGMGMMEHEGAGCGHTRMMGEGMMGAHMMGHGMMNQYMMSGPIMRLGLSEAQREQIRTLQHKMEKDHLSHMSEMLDLRYEMQGLMEQEKPDPKAVGKLAEKRFQIERQMMEEGITSHNAMMDVLTREQRDELKKGEPAREMHQHMNE